MDTLATAADVFRDHPVVQTAFAATIGLGLVVMPFAAMNADPLEETGSESITEYGEKCNSGCDTHHEICCNDPIG